MRLRSLIAAAAVSALGIGLTACGGDGNGDSGSGGDTLTYWASNQGTSLDNDKQVLKPVLDKFTAETGVKVNLEVIGWNDLQTRIQTAITSGQAPDVLNIGNTWAASLQATDAFLPFDDEAMKAIGGKEKFVETALATGGAAGKPRRPCRSTASRTASTTTRRCSPRPGCSRRRPGRKWSRPRRS